jgi:NhaP-type Na+/H+ or K+/H+ antiporter
MNKTHIILFAAAAVAGFFLANASSGSGIYAVSGIGSVANTLYAVGNPT